MKNGVQLSCAASVLVPFLLDQIVEPGIKGLEKPSGLVIFETIITLQLKLFLYSPNIRPVNLLRQRYIRDPLTFLKLLYYPFTFFFQSTYTFHITKNQRLKPCL